MGTNLYAQSVTSSDDSTTKTTTSQDPRLDPQRIRLDGEPVPMSLAEVIMTAFDQNLEVDIQLKDVEIAREQYFAEKGIYDPVLGASVGYRVIDGESNSSAFAASPGTSTTDDGTVIVDQTQEEASVSLSQLVPSGATLSLGVDRTRTDYRDSRSNSLTFDPEESQRAYIRITQPLLKNFGPTVTNLGIRLARIERQIQRSLYKQEVENQIAAVMSAYWDLVFAIRNLDVQRASLEAALELERVNEVRVRTGSAPRSDLFQAQAQVAQRRNNVITAKSQILAAQDRLLSLMNWSDPESQWDNPIDPTDLPDKYDLELKYDDDTVITEALMDRDDLIAARLSVRAAETTKDATWWQRFPELNAIAEYGLTGTDDSVQSAWDEVEAGDYEDWFVGLEFKYPIFNTTPRANYRRAKLQIEQAALGVDRLELAVATQARAATRSVRTAQESIEASEAQVRAAEETLSAERKRLDVGSSTTFNVLDFQEDLAQAQVNQVQSQVNFQKGLIELERSRGTLLDTIAADLGLTFDFEEEITKDEADRLLGEKYKTIEVDEEQ